jgi:L-ascorbate metabolism protein UlaG (beta-lactamase superfamily)
MSYRKRTVAESVLLLAALVLSAPAAADVVLTQLANGGVRIDDGETRVIIDGMVVEPYAIYSGLPEAARAEFDAARGVYGGVDLVLASHRHHDHNQPAFACDFLQRSVETRMVTSAEVIGLMREKCRGFVTGSERVRAIDPQPGAPVVIEQGTARVTVFRLSHGKRKYARIENFAHLVEIGGLRLLHIGDGAMDPEAFEAAGLAGVAADVAFVPIWFFQPGPGEAVVRGYLDAPRKIAVQVPADEVPAARDYLAGKYPEALLLDPLQVLALPAP